MGKSKKMFNLDTLKALFIFYLNRQLA